MKLLFAAVAASASLLASAAAQELPSQFRSLVFLDALAIRGEACGLLAPWQGAALAAQVDDATRGWDETHRTQLDTDAAARAAALGCDDEGMNVWINGAQRGMESEILAHYIVAYRALSQMNPPPAPFVEASTRGDHAGASAAIEQKLQELQASGAVPEGGHPWPDFIARTSAGVTEMARAYDAGEPPPRASREQAEAWFRDSARITELWLQESEPESAGE
jgi:hypothetical protein